MGYPLDTVKVKIQTQDVKNGQTLYKGTFDCFFKLARKDGVCQQQSQLRKHAKGFLQVRSLYKGMSSPLVGVAGINAITFGAYGNVLRMLPQPESITSIALAGSAAGLIQVIIKRI